MRKLRKSMLFAFLVAAVVSCGGGSGGDSSSNTPTPIGHTLVSVNSNRLNVPEKPGLETDINYSNSWVSNEKVYIRNGISTATINAGEILGFNFPISNPTTVTVKKNGIAFDARHPSENFEFNDITPLPEQIKDYLDNISSYSELPHLTLNMEEGSFLFMARGGNIKTSQINKNLFSTAINKPVIIGDNYKEILLSRANLLIDKDANLDDPNDSYNLIKVENSNITVESNVTIKD